MTLLRAETSTYRKIYVIEDVTEQRHSARNKARTPKFHIASDSGRTFGVDI